MAFVLFLIVICVAVVLVVKTSKNNKSYEETQKDAAKPEEIDLAAEVERVAVRVETMIQSEMAGDEATHQAVMDEKYNGPWPQRRSDGGFLSMYDNLRILKIAGINHRSKIAGYTGRIESALVPDPKNEYDPDAIKVVAKDGHHLGYIKMDQTDMVRSWTGEKFPYYCRSFIHEISDVDDQPTYEGFVYIKLRDKGQ